METISSDDLSRRIAEELAREYERIRQKVRGLVDGLTTEQLWQRPFPYGNSVGHLLLHLTGNLSYYIGAQIGASGYVRDRPREFSEDSGRPKDEVLKAFDRALDLVVSTLAAQTAQDWGRAYEAVGAGDAPNRLAILIHCAAHADHHAGQMIYLCKQLALTADPRP